MTTNNNLLICLECQWIGRKEELKTSVLDIAPTLYELIPVCPSCGFASYLKPVETSDLLNVK